tara:strand:- start:242 stop:802 length:561 start_codon:yes stop_codon:yes gene_type:complete
MYFATQENTDVNCVVLAINNLFGEPIATRDTLLKMKVKNKGNRNQNICDESRGIICQNKIIEHMLKMIQTEKIKVSRQIKTLFENTTAVTWYDLKKQLNNKEFDGFFKKFHTYIVGIYGNRTHSKGIGHAVCVRRGTDGKNLWLLDSLETERKRVSLQKLTTGTYKLQPFVVILKNTYFKPQLASA